MSVQGQQIIQYNCGKCGHGWTAELKEGAEVPVFNQPDPTPAAPPQLPELPDDPE